MNKLSKKKPRHSRGSVVPASAGRTNDGKSSEIRGLNPESQWFGFTQVTPSEKTAKVREVFDSVAYRYDLMNDLMSGGLHRLWKNHLVEIMRPKAGQIILDVAGGTGDIALRCAEHSGGKARVIVCDINLAMLKVGRDKAIDSGWVGKNAPIEWLVGNAENLPIASRSVDTVCIAFGLRNVTRIDAALSEFARVLKPGGRFFCMEFTPNVSPFLKPIYEQYCSLVLPWLGDKVANDRKSYQYLAESIRQFPSQDALAKRMEKAGMSMVKWQNLMGGIAVVHSGWKI